MYKRKVNGESGGIGDGEQCAIDLPREGIGHSIPVRIVRWFIGRELALLYDPEAQNRESEQRFRKLRSYLEKQRPTKQADLYRMRIIPRSHREEYEGWVSNGKLVRWNTSPRGVKPSMMVALPDDPDVPSCVHDDLNGIEEA